MKIENQFRVSAPLEEAWAILTDVPTIAPCMPGAQLTGSDGDTHSGKVKIKVGPVIAEYAGTATFIAKSETNHRAELSAKGRDSRGSGNAEAIIVAQLEADGNETQVSIDTDLKVSGKVAQFGRGVMADVSKKLIDQFVECLENKVRDQQGETADEVAAAGAEPTEEPAAAGAGDDVEALDLMEMAGGAMAKRLVPVIAVLIVVAVVLWLLVS